MPCLGILFLSATLPLVMVSATAPLVQHWFALTGHPRAHDPYFLYAASNAGSLLALLAYPFLIEPNLGLAAQSQIWRTGFLILAILVLTCGVAAWRRGRSIERSVSERSGPVTAQVGDLSLATWLRWLILVFVPSSWLMGVTSYLTTDLAAIPLLWTIPLALYLLSFILAFAQSTAGVVSRRDAGASFCRRAVGAGHECRVRARRVDSAPFAGVFRRVRRMPRALAQLRPPARYASTFYVTIAIGGLLGGIFNALVAPIVFDRVIEYPLAVVLACLVAPAINSGLESTHAQGMAGRSAHPGRRVSADGGLGDQPGGAGRFGRGRARRDGRRGPGTLFLRDGPAAADPVRARGPGGAGGQRPGTGSERPAAAYRAQLFRSREGDVRRRAETCIGCSTAVPCTGSRASTRPSAASPRPTSRAPGRSAKFSPRSNRGWSNPMRGSRSSDWEREPWRATPGQASAGRSMRSTTPSCGSLAIHVTLLIYAIAQADAIEIVLGDARLRLHDAPDQAYRLIVLDAFSSDAVPVHLISREAIRLYRVQARPNGGMLAVQPVESLPRPRPDHGPAGRRCGLGLPGPL